MNFYDLARGLHILAVIAWMAGLLYLPRLYAYHTETAPPGTEFDAHFQVWERKLLSIIMTPAMTIAWIFGLWLIHLDIQARGADFITQPWMIAKLAGVIFLTGWHTFLAGARKDFVAGHRKRQTKFWRATNELPFIAAIVMVIAVTVEPFARS